MTRILVIAALFLALVATDAAARAVQIRWQQVAIADGQASIGRIPLAGDGSMVAWEQGGTTVVVARPRQRLRKMREPLECRRGLLAAGAHYLLFRCGPDGELRTRFTVINVDTRRIKHLVWSGHRDGLDLPEFGSIGEQWIAGSSTAYHADTVTVFWNWRTGRKTNDADTSFGPRKYLDLAAPDLGRPLCAPLRRHPYDEPTTESVPAYWAVTVSGRWVLDGAAPPALRRCGTRRVRRFPAAISLQAGIVTWTTQRDRLHALRLRDGARYVGRNPDHFRMISTPTALYSAQLVRDGHYEPVTHWRILRAALG